MSASHQILNMEFRQLLHQATRTHTTRGCESNLIACARHQWRLDQRTCWSKLSRISTLAKVSPSPKKWSQWHRSFNISGEFAKPGSCMLDRVAMYICPMAAQGCQNFHFDNTRLSALANTRRKFFFFGRRCWRCWFPNPYCSKKDYLGRIREPRRSFVASINSETTDVAPERLATRTTHVTARIRTLGLEASSCDSQVIIQAFVSESGFQ